MELGLVECHSLNGASRADIEHMTQEYNKLCSPDLLADRVIAILQGQKGMYGGALVDLYEHGLKTATR